MMKKETTIAGLVATALTCLMTLVPTTLSAQRITPHCKTCGKAISDCKYKGRHPSGATQHNSSSAPSATGRLHAPSAPSPRTTKARTIGDLLYFPYGCLTSDVNSKEKAQQALTSLYGRCETINGFYKGLHHDDTSFFYTYKGTPIGVVFIDWNDNREFYHFYLNSKAEADNFYATMVKDLKAAGIPLTYDKVYGHMSNRKHPVSIFSWVYVDKPKKITSDNLCCNINLPQNVGQYVVEVGVFKRNK